jgi:hypothetical protein
LGTEVAALLVGLAIGFGSVACKSVASGEDKGNQLPEDVIEIGQDVPDEIVGEDAVREIHPGDEPVEEVVVEETVGDFTAVDLVAPDVVDPAPEVVDPVSEVLPDANVPCPEFAEATVQGHLDSVELPEASGLAASRRDVGLLWTHNDSGDNARLYALKSDGTVVGRFDLAGLKAGDWEDIALGPFGGLSGDALFVADTGDNLAARSTVVVHVLAEPELSESPDPVEVPVLASLELSYPDGPVDCESMFVDPVSGDIYLVAKEVREDQTSRLFRKAAPHVSSAGVTVLQEVALIPVTLATGAGITPDGSLLVVRTYFGGGLFRRMPGQTIQEAVTGAVCELPPFPSEPQGEAVALVPDGSAFVTVSEYRGEGSQDIHFTVFSWVSSGS